MEFYNGHDKTRNRPGMGTALASEIQQRIWCFGEGSSGKALQSDSSSSSSVTKSLQTKALLSQAQQKPNTRDAKDGKRLPRVQLAFQPFIEWVWHSRTRMNFNEQRGSDSLESLGANHRNPAGASATGGCWPRPRPVYHYHLPHFLCPGFGFTESSNTLLALLGEPSGSLDEGMWVDENRGAVIVR
jgi:hypothetical protein